MSIKIRNWHKFQHFKDRKPPWIKLYRDILDDILWHELDSDAAKCLISFWLIASEHGGYLPTTKELAFRLRTTEKSIKSNISKLSPWLEQDDIKPISDINAISSGYQETRLETETETETEKRDALPSWLDVEKWTAYVKTRKAQARKPESLKAALDKLEGFMRAGHNPNEIIATSLANGWQGLFEPKSNGGGHAKFNPVQYVNSELAKALGASPAQKVCPDVHGEVHQVLSGPRDD